MYRLYFAVWPDAALRRQLSCVASHWQQAQSFAGKVIAADDYHLTLAFLGSSSQAQFDAAADAAAGLHLPRFDCQLDRTGTFGRKIAWLGSHHASSGLLELHRQLSKRLEQARLPVDKRPFRPHVSLFRRLNRAPDPLDFATIHWPVREFVLVNSRPASGATHYQVLQRYPLDGQIR